MKISSLHLPLIVPNAVYAVAFFVPASGAFQCLDTSYIFLRFMDRYIRSGDYRRFTLISLSYRLGPSGSFGLLIFDKHLRTAYTQVRTRARLSRNIFRREYEYPICTWPGNSIELKRPNVVRQLVRSVRYAFGFLVDFFAFSFSTPYPDFSWPYRRRPLQPI
jgi:hypothetical protein